MKVFQICTRHYDLDHKDKAPMIWVSAPDRKHVETCTHFVSEVIEDILELPISPSDPDIDHSLPEERLQMQGMILSQLGEYLSGVNSHG